MSPLCVALLSSKACKLFKGSCSCESLCLITTSCAMFFIFWVLNVPSKANIFTCHCCNIVVYCCNISALVQKLTRAINLSVFDHGYTIKMTEIICTFDSDAGEMKGVYFLVHVYAAHCSEHCLYFHIVYLLSMVVK